jgi:hypothetical protein
MYPSEYMSWLTRCVGHNPVVRCVRQMQLANGGRKRQICRSGISCASFCVDVTITEWK